MAVFFTRRGAPPSLGTRLGDLEIGTIVHIKESDVYQDYLVVNQGLPSSMYDSSCNGTWMLRSHLSAGGIFGNNNNYPTSTVAQWLEETFLPTLDAEIQGLVKDVKIPYKGSSGGVQSGSNGFQCKAFLLSGMEVGIPTSNGGDYPIDGSKLSYFQSGNSSAANSIRTATYNGSAKRWLTRSPSLDIPTRVVYVQATGNYFYGSPDGVGYYYRPAFILPPDLLVDDNNDILV